MSDAEQNELPFADADAARAGKVERCVAGTCPNLGTKCDLHLSRFVRMVFDFTHGGTEGEFVKSYKALAERPSWLCCSVGKARSTVEVAKSFGFVSIEEQRSWDGSQKPNAYVINWDGIYAILKGRITDVTTAQPPATTAQGSVTTAQSPVTTWHHTKEEKLSGSFIEESSGTGTGAVPDPVFFRFGKGFWRRSTADGGRRDSAERYADGCSAGTVADFACGKGASDRCLCQPASWCMASTRPSRWIIYETLLRLMVKWHRMQLSTAVPVMGNSEADLLLTIAAALYAMKLLDSEITNNRVAVFVHTIASKEVFA